MSAQLAFERQAKQMASGIRKSFTGFAKKYADTLTPRQRYEGIYGAGSFEKAQAAATQKLKDSATSRGVSVAQNELDKAAKAGVFSADVLNKAKELVSADPNLKASTALSRASAAFKGQRPTDTKSPDYKAYAPFSTKPIISTADRSTPPPPRPKQEPTIEELGKVQAPATGPGADLSAEFVDDPKAAEAEFAFQKTLSGSELEFYKGLSRSEQLSFRNMNPEQRTNIMHLQGVETANTETAIAQSIFDATGVVLSRFKNAIDTTKRSVTQEVNSDADLTAAVRKYVYEEEGLSSGEQNIRVREILSGKGKSLTGGFALSQDSGAQDIFDAIVMGQIKPSKTNEQWTDLYENGKPTEAQLRAWQMWESRNTYGGMSSQQLFQSIKDGKIVPSKSNALWTALYSNGMPTPEQIEAYQLWDNYNKEELVNGEQQFIYDVIKNGTDAADPNANEKYKVSTAFERITSGYGDLKSQTDNLLASFTPDYVSTSDGEKINLTGDGATSALGLYNELFAENEKMQGLNDEINSVQAEIDEIAAAELAMENDIRKMVEGEAPESYIQALAAKRSRDLYPKKFTLTQNLTRLKAEVAAEQQHIGNVMKYTLADEEMRYNRFFQALQLSLQQEGKSFDRELRMQEFLMNLPKGRSFTYQGTRYEGMGEDANLNIVSFTDNAGKVWVIGLDKNTGVEKYRQLVGQGAVKKSGGGSGTSTRKMLQEEFWQGVQDGSIVKVGTSYYDATKYSDFTNRYNELVGEDKPGWFTGNYSEEEATAIAAQETGLTEVIKP